MTETFQKNIVSKIIKSMCILYTMIPGKVFETHVFTSSIQKYN